MNKVLIIPIALLLFSCSAKPKVIEKEVFVRCPVPDIPKTEKPKIDMNNTYVEKLKAIVDYLFKLEYENELLRNALQVCKGEE